MLVVRDFLTPNERIFFTHIKQLSNSLIPAKYPTSEFNSDTTYLYLDSAGLRVQTHKTALTSDTGHKYWVCTSDQPAINWDFRISHLLERLPGLRKHFIYVCQFILTDTSLL